MKFNRVVVTGIGAITPLGNSVSSFWENLKAGVSGCASITQFDTTQFRTKIACEVKDFHPENFFDKKELKKLDAFGQYALISADEAIKDAALLDYTELNKKRVGVLFTSGFGGATHRRNRTTPSATATRASELSTATPGTPPDLSRSPVSASSPPIRA